MRRTPWTSMTSYTFQSSFQAPGLKILRSVEADRCANSRNAKEQDEASTLGVNLNNLGRIKQNPHQLRRTISNLLRTLYALDFREADPIVDILVVGLLA